MHPCCSYLICATPRSGSTLLCEALKNTGIAGRPEEYFEALIETGRPRRPKDYFKNLENTTILEQLGDYSRIDYEPVRWSPLSAPTYADYLAEAIAKGTTPNGIFGAKVMWGYFNDFISHLRQVHEYREMAVPDILATIFPDLHYIWVTRRDKVRQAVSLWKAIQTWTWRADELQSPSGEPSQSARELVFNFEAIDHLLQRIEIHEVAWREYFAACGIRPFTVVYEELALAYEATAIEILQYLGIAIPDDLVFAERNMKQQANTLSEEWVQRYYFEQQEFSNLRS
jgi:LPS sulfotransferase NodH